MGARFVTAESDMRKSARVGLTGEVTLRRAGKTNYRVRAFDVSREGCRLEFIERPDLGESLWVKFEGMELLQARVCRTESFTAGVEFLKPLHPAVFDLLVSRLAGSAGR
jgi:hypothetical protein